MSNPPPGPSEVNELSSIRPVNYSIQTGEEFSLEFMRERVHSRNLLTHNTPGSQINSGFIDSRGTLGISQPEYEKPLIFPDSRSHVKGTHSTQFNSSADGSNHGNPSVNSSSGVSEAVSSKKFLCSFGGKILPRPSDGKLRYVGGETRMIRLNKDISWQEFVRKISAIYSQYHTIKYQLPGEDLDALVSVSCDEDLQNMMEEYSVLPSGEGSQKLRIFIFSPMDCNDVQFGVGSTDGDSEVRYVVAINGMDYGSGKMSLEKSDLLNLKNDDDVKVLKSSTITGQYSLPVSLGVSPDVSIDQRMNARADFSDLKSRVLTLPSLPSDYGQYAEASISVPSNDLNPASKLGVVIDGIYDNFQTEQILGVKDAKLNAENERIGLLDTHQNDAISAETHVADESYLSLHQDHMTSPQKPKVKGHSEHEVCDTKLSPIELGKDFMATPLKLKEAGQSEDEVSDLKISSFEMGTDAVSGGSNSRDPDASGVEAECFSPNDTVVNDINHDDGPHHFRVFHSERIPRGQFDSIHRLSKSDDSMGSQIRIPQLMQESLSSNQIQAEISTLQNPNTKITAVDDGLLHFHKYEGMADTILLKHQVETELTKEGGKIPSSHLPILPENDVSNQAWHDSEEEMHIQRANLSPHSFTSYDQKIRNNEMISLEGDSKKHLDYFMPEVPPGKVNIQSPEISIATGLGNLSEFHWGEMSTESIYDNDFKGQTMTQLASQSDICIDIDDGVPQDLLSDLFSKASSPPESSTAHNLISNDIGHSLDINNPEPKRWSFFRNLTEFTRPQKDVSLIDQDQIPFTSAMANTGALVPISYEFSDREMVYNASQLGFVTDISGPSDDATDSGSVAHLYMPTQAVTHLQGVVEKTDSLLNPPSEYKVMSSIKKLLNFIQVFFRYLT